MDSTISSPQSPDDLFKSTQQKLNDSIDKIITKSMQELTENIVKGIKDAINIHLRKKPLQGSTKFTPTNRISNKKEIPSDKKPKAEEIHNTSTKFQPDAHDSPSENEVKLRLRPPRIEPKHSKINDFSDKNYYFQWLQFMNKPKFIKSNRYDQNRRSTNFITIFDPGTNIFDTIVE